MERLRNLVRAGLVFFTALGIVPMLGAVLAVLLLSAWTQTQTVDPRVLTGISVLAGILSRVFIPWLQERRDAPEDTGKWAWKYIWPQLLGVVIILIGLPFLIPELAEVLELPWQAAWLVGYGSAAVGNLAGREARHRTQ